MCSIYLFNNIKSILNIKFILYIKSILNVDLIYMAIYDNETLQEKELDILRKAVDKAENNASKKSYNSPEIKYIIDIVEVFLKKNDLVCYGGTAINNILPVSDQFYNRDIEIPDYDFFSPNALNDAKKLADIYFSRGYTEVEAKAGVHPGTFKVFVNYIPVADITFLDKKLFKVVLENAIKINNIFYAPPNYLRMSMYLELSRPEGMVSRWEKVLKRLILLNKNYPLEGKNCVNEDFMRIFEGDKDDQHKIYNIVKCFFIDEGLVFFGGYACTLYGKYMPKRHRRILDNIPDFDVLSETPFKTAYLLKKKLIDEGYDNTVIKKKNGVGEIIAAHYEIIIGKETVAFIYEPLACHSYNIIKINKKQVKIATIDTMLSFYLAFLYANRPYYDHNRIICMAEYLFLVQAKNRLKQRGLLKRFSINCYGKQETLNSMRNEKNKKFQELKDKKNSAEYEYYFLRYIPTKKRKIKSKNKKTKAKAKIKNRKTKKHIRKSKNQKPKTKNNM